MELHVHLRSKEDFETPTIPITLEELFKATLGMESSQVSYDDDIVTVDLTNKYIKVNLWSSSDAEYVRMSSISRRKVKPEEMSCIHLRVEGKEHAREYSFLDDEVMVVPKSYVFYVADDTEEGGYGSMAVGDMAPGTVIQGTNGYDFVVTSIYDGEAKGYAYKVDTDTGSFDLNFLAVCVC